MNFSEPENIDHHYDVFYEGRLYINLDNLIVKLELSFDYLKSISIQSVELLQIHYKNQGIYKFTRLIFSKENQPKGLPDYEELEYIDFYYNTDDIYMEKYKTFVKLFYEDTRSVHIMYYINKDNKCHCDIQDKAAFLSFYKQKTIECKKHFKNGLLHNDFCPAIINFDENEEIIKCLYYENGLLHREDGPAVEKMIHFYEEGNYPGSKDSYESRDLSHSYFYRGVRHRSDGPSFIDFQNENNNKYYLHGIELTKNIFDSIDNNLKLYNEFFIPSYTKLNNLYD